MNGSKFPIFRTGVGQDSHRFLTSDSSKPCILGGVIFPNVPGLDSESDGDVVYHSICNAITSLTHVPILKGIALELCRKDGITDSEVYLIKALETLRGIKIAHVALSIEGKRPSFAEYLEKMRKNIARTLRLDQSQVGITVTTGDGLTDFGCGDGLQCFCILSTVELEV